ncbi:MAG: transposase family protein, partial [Planctomycetes bacterium]|nr:transposase family protein [Planctomycetota bacterium]
DTQIEDTARTCETCGKYGKNLPKLVDHPWAKATAPFQRVHVDFAGPFLGSMWLLLVDAYSKWPEIIQMNANTTSRATIRALRSIFARTGIAMTLVSDNGPQFISEEIEDYLRSSGIKHVTVPTYSPKSNGICERLVQTFKGALKKMNESCKDVSKNLYDFLLTYRNTPHSSTGQTPAVLACNRTLRFNLHQIKPADHMKVQALQSEKLQKVVDERKKDREFEENQEVLVKMDDRGPWVQARVIKRYGDNSNNYAIQYQDRVVKKHADVLKPRYSPVIRMKRDNVPERQRQRLTEDLDRTNLKFQKLDETLERRRQRAESHVPVPDPTATVFTRQQSARPASPLKQQSKYVRESESSPIVTRQSVPRPSVISSSEGATDSPSVVRSSVSVPDQRPNRSAKTSALIKMKGMK